MAESFNSGEWLRWEKRCIKRARKGDREAVGELYQAFADPLYSRILLPRLGCADAAGDALAETFRTAIERLDQYSDQGKSIWSWLTRIAVNKATDMYRARSRTARALSSFENLMGPTWSSGEAPDLETERADRSEWLKVSIGQIMERLNPRYRQAIELRFFEDRGRGECAEIMDVKIGTFDVVLLRALRAFRREWDTSVGTTPEEG